MKNIKEKPDKRGVFDEKSNAAKNFDEVKFEILTKEKCLNLFNKDLKDKNLSAAQVKKLQKQIDNLKNEKCNYVLLQHTYSTLKGVNNDRKDVFLTFLNAVPRQAAEQKHFVFEVAPEQYVLVNSKNYNISDKVDNLPEYINGYFILKQAGSCYYFRDRDGYISPSFVDAKPFIKNKDGRHTAFAKTGNLITRWVEIDSNYFLMGNVAKDKDGKPITKDGKAVIEPKFYRKVAGNEFFGAWETTKDAHPFYQVYLTGQDSRDWGVGAAVGNAKIDEIRQYDRITNLEDEGLLKLEQFRVNEITKLPYTVTSYVDIIGRTLTEENKRSGTMLYYYKTGKVLEPLGREVEISDFFASDFVNKNETDKSGDIYLQNVLEIYAEKQLGKLNFDLLKKKVSNKKLTEEAEETYNQFKEQVTEMLTAGIRRKNTDAATKERLKNLREELTDKIKTYKDDFTLIKQTAEENAKKSPKKLPAKQDKLIAGATATAEPESPKADPEPEVKPEEEKPEDVKPEETKPDEVKIEQPKQEKPKSNKKKTSGKKQPEEEPVKLEDDGIVEIYSVDGPSGIFEIYGSSDKIYKALTEMKSIDIGNIQKRYGISFKKAEQLLIFLSNKGLVEMGKSGKYEIRKEFEDFVKAHYPENGKNN